MLHSPRTVRLHHETGDLVCFNTYSHPIATLTPAEAVLLGTETGVSKNEMRTRLRNRQPFRLAFEFANWLNNRLSHPKCGLVGAR